MKATKDDLSALSDVLNMDINDEDFEFSELLNNTEELVLEEEKREKVKKVTKLVSEDDKDYSDISEPHWLVERDELQRLLDTISNVIVKSGEVVNRSLHVVNNDDHLVFSFTSNDILGEFKLKLVNSKNVLTDKTFVLDYSKLQVAVKNSDSKVVFKDKPSSQTLVVELLGGEVELENYLGLDENNFNHFKKTDTESLTKSDIDFKTFETFLKNVYSSDKLSLRADDRKVRIQGNEGYSNYSLIIVNYKDIQLKDFSIRLLDVSYLLKSLSVVQSSLQLAQTDTHNYVITDNYKIALPKVQTEDLKYVKRICGSLNIKSEFTLETLQFYKKLNLIRQLAGNGVSVHLLTVGGELTINAKTSNQRDVKFAVASGLDTGVNIDVRLPVMTLMNTFKMFKDYTTIKVGVTDNQRFVFEVDMFKLIFGGLI